jgi:hypothetical protein
MELDPAEDPFAPVPPLPDDPELLAQLQARLDRGVASVLAGRGIDASVLHARLRAKYNLR